MEGIGNEEREGDAQGEIGIANVEGECGDAPAAAVTFPGDHERMFERADRRLPFPIAAFGHGEGCGVEQCDVLQIDEPERGMAAVEIGDERLIERGLAGVEWRLLDEKEIPGGFREIEIRRDEIVEDDGVELRRQRRGEAIGREQLEGEALVGREQFFEEPVALRDEQHALGWLDGQHGVGDIIGGERVVGIQLRGEPAAGGVAGAGDRRKNLHGAPARLDGEGFHVEQLAVVRQFHVGLRDGAAKIGDFEEDFGSLRTVEDGACGETGDGEVVPRRAHGDEIDRHVEADGLGRRGVVGVDDDLAFAAPGGQQFTCEFDGAIQFAAGIRGRCFGECFAQAFFIVGEGADDSRGGVGGDESHLPQRGGFVHDVGRFRFGFGEAGLAVGLGRLHARAGVHDEHRGSAFQDLPVEGGMGEGAKNEREDEEVEKEGEKLAKLLEKSTAAALLEDTLPEKQGGDWHGPTLQLQQIEQDDDRGDAGESHSPGVEEGHWIILPSRKTRSTRSSNGTAVVAWA